MVSCRLFVSRVPSVGKFVGKSAPGTRRERPWRRLPAGLLDLAVRSARRWAPMRSS
jgi:hypothetical protein